MICKYYLMIGSDTVDTADNSCIDRITHDCQYQ